MSNPNVAELDFRLENLGELDGGVGAEVVARQIARIIDDIRKRPADKSKRKLKVIVEFAPKAHLENDDYGGKITILDGVSAKLKASVSMPDQSTAEYDIGVKEDGRVVFNPEHPFNHRQASLPFERGIINSVASAVAQ